LLDTRKTTVITIGEQTS